MKRSNKIARAVMKLLCLFLGVILAAMLAVTVYAQSVAGDNPRAFLVKAANSQTAKSILSKMTENNKKMNILLIGQDGREGEGGKRSDTMILCTVDPKSRQLTMTSFLRDLYIPIPGYGNNRINAAYAYGGAQLLRDTIEENFQVRIDGCVEVDFERFPRIIDLLGGVKLELRQDEANLINQETGSVLKAGVQSLTGQQALSYARIRKLDWDGDFSRTERQRKVLEAVWSSYKDIGMTTMIKTLGSLLPMIETDMGSGELLSCAMNVFPMLSDMEIISQKIPESGYYTDRMIDGMAVLVPDMEAARQTLKELTGS